MRMAAMMLAGAATALWAAPATAKDCGALARKHAGSVVVGSATTVEPPAGGWSPVTDSFYKPPPVHVRLCRVEGTIEGNIGFELGLPLGDGWNGRRLGAGGGGDAGVYNYNDMSRRIGEGFATVTTDSGHKASVPQKKMEAKARTDYEHRAVHLTALGAKARVARGYGRAADKSYFLGCSGGGRQALKEMQRYPADYDGVVAGAPGPYKPLNSELMMWLSLLQKHDPVAALSDADWSLYETAVFAACDQQDGVKAGVVETPLGCHAATAALLCKAGLCVGCLTAPQLAM